MKIEDVIEGLNSYLDLNRKDKNHKGHFVLQKRATTNETFKAYKLYIYTLWYVSKNTKAEILNVQYSGKVVEGNDISVLNFLNIELCKSIFNFVNSDIYNKIINGEYDN